MTDTDRQDAELERSERDREVADEFVENAKAESLDPDGVLTGLTKQVLEAGLDARADRASRIRQARRRGPGWRQSPQRHPIQSKTVFAQGGAVALDVTRLWTSARPLEVDPGSLDGLLKVMTSVVGRLQAYPA